jgi:hypothetical protein
MDVFLPVRWDLLSSVAKSVDVGSKYCIQISKCRRWCQLLIRERRYKGFTSSSKYNVQTERSPKCNNHLPMKDGGLVAWVGTTSYPVFYYLSGHKARTLSRNFGTEKRVRKSIISFLCKAYYYPPRCASQSSQEIRYYPRCSIPQDRTN